jgi:hypothetical protein
MTPMNIAVITLLNGICLGAVLAAAMMLLLKLFPRLNSTMVGYSETGPLARSW